MGKGAPLNGLGSPGPTLHSVQVRALEEVCTEQQSNCQGIPSAGGHCPKDC